MRHDGGSREVARCAAEAANQPRAYDKGHGRNACRGPGQRDGVATRIDGGDRRPGGDDALQISLQKGFAHVRTRERGSGGHVGASSSSVGRMDDPLDPVGGNGVDWSDGSETARGLAAPRDPEGIAEARLARSTYGRGAGAPRRQRRRRVGGEVGRGLECLARRSPTCSERPTNWRYESLPRSGLSRS